MMTLLAPCHLRNCFASFLINSLTDGAAVKCTQNSDFHVWGEKAATDFAQACVTYHCGFPDLQMASGQQGLQLCEGHEDRWLTPGRVSRSALFHLRHCFLENISLLRIAALIMS